MFINYEKEAALAVNEIKRKGIFRNYPLISAISENSPYGTNEKNGEKVIIWGNNNYLGLSTHPKVIAAKVSATEKFGASSSGTRNVLGTSKLLDELEKKLAKFHNKEKALVHISALDANIGCLSALGKLYQNAVFLSDENNHASIIDGIRASGATKYIFKHNDILMLDEKLKEIRALSDARPIIIVIESVYSMSGDIAPLKEIVALKQKCNALLFVDEVHAVGLRGENGAGIAREYYVEDEVDIICGTLGKAVGCSGGYVAASNNMIEFLRHNSRNFIYTTALAPDVAASAIAALEIIESDEGKILREKQKIAVQEFKQTLKKQKIDFVKNETHIVPVIIGDETKTAAIAGDLLDIYKIAVTPIFAPTVAVGSARLRINPTPYHTKVMAEEFTNALRILLDKYSNMKVVANSNQQAKLRKLK